MTANVDIQTKKKINVLSVPIEAVTTRSDSALGKKTKDKSIEKSIKKTDIESAKQNEIVFINIKSLARVKKVKTGIQDNNYIEITEGLKENEEVITAPYSAISRKLKDSMLIKVKEKKDLFGDK
jgi:HlyD family secretion protein